MSEKKLDVWSWVYWIGLVIFAYGLVTFITSIWSPEAMKTAGEFGIYGAPTIAVIGIALSVVGFFQRKKKS